MASALGVEYLFATATLAGAKGTLIAMLLGAIVAMMGSMALTGTAVWPKVRTAVFFPAAIGVGMLAGVGVAGRTDLMLGVFVAVMFAAVFVRRFGLPFFFYGFMGWMGYFFASFLHATLPMMPSLIAAVAVGTAWVLLLSITLLRTNPTRTLRRTVRAFDARARAVARAGAELLERAGAERDLDRARRVLRARQARLAEVALMVEGWSAEPGALPAGWSAPALRRRLIDAQQTIERLATSADALAASNTELAATAVPILVRLARRDDLAANRAAHALAEAAEAAEGRALTGWWPARHLSVAVLEFVALARAVGTPPEIEEIDEFEPAVSLAMGNLPGSPSVARDVPARGGRWNPLARLDMTTRQAIQVAVAGGLAILIGRELSATRYYWAVIAAFIMFTGTGTRSETFIKGANRVAGTLVGLVVAIWLAHLTAGHTAWVLVAIVASMFCGFYLVRISYGYMIFFITIMVGQLYSVLHEFSNGLLVLRLEETAIGAAVGFVVALVVVPLGTRDTVRAARNSVLTALADLLTAAGQRLGAESDDEEGADDAVPGLDGLTRGLDDRLRQLSLVAKPLTRPLVWGNSPPRTRHRLALYAATATHARELTIALRSRDGHTAGPGAACRALAAAATQLTETLPGRRQPAAVQPLTDADTALFAEGAVAPGARATDPVIQPLIHLQHLLRELAVPGQPPESGTEPQHIAVAARATTSPVPVTEDSGVALPPVAASGDGVAMLTGTIATPEGTPISTALLVLLDATGRPAARTRSDEHGRYRIDECRQGRYIAAVTAAGHQATAARVTLLADSVNRADLAIAADCAPTGRVCGTVRGPAAVGPLPEVALTVLDGSGTVIAHTRTDAKGHYRFPALPVGHYTVVASGYPPAVTTTRLRAGGDHDLPLTLPKPDYRANHYQPAQRRCDTQPIRLA
ncbi:MAG: carboxypeptidase regulatory-like domain-containing protein [Sciscionella sp.]